MMPDIASVFPQGYLKTAEISVTAYLKRPWFCDNVTGRKELLYIFYMRVNQMSRMRLSLRTEKNIDLDYSKLKCIVPVHVSKCTADVQVFSFFYGFVCGTAHLCACIILNQFQWQPAGDRGCKFPFLLLASFLLLFTHTLMKVLSSLL